MKRVLKDISEIAIRNADVSYLDEQIEAAWIGFPPASLDDVHALERSLGLSLPADYRDFLLVTNGFSAVNDSTEPSFAPVDQVDYLINLDKELIDIWLEHGVPETGETLSKSILVGGLGEEQCFLLIPPVAASVDWQYWKFASWIPGEQPFVSLTAYFVDVLNFLKKES